MNRHLDTQWLKSLCGAWENAKVYGASHAGYRRSIDRCAKMLARMTKSGETVTLAMCDDGLIVGNGVSIDPALTGSGFLKALAGRDVSLINVRKGVCTSDIEWLLDVNRREPGTSSPSGAVQLERADVEATRKLLESARSSGASFEDEAAQALRLAEPEQSILPLKTVWTSLLAGQETMPAEVGALAANITSAVLTMRGGVLPLLQLKDHDEYTFVHAVNVGLIASMLGRAVGLTEEKLRSVTEAALLHDIGKRMVPLVILNKKAKLDESEQAVMRMHPAFGASLLSGVRGATDVMVVVAYEHHLRIDGGGYPISSRRRPPALVSQLVQVADIFDALRSDRPYRRGCETQEVLDIMSREAGGAFDRDLFRVLCNQVARCIRTPAGRFEPSTRSEAA